MKVVWKECRKILNIRLLLLLGIFTFVYYMLYIQVITMNRDNTEFTMCYDLYLELVEQFGPVVSMDQYDNELHNIKLELSQKRDELVQENETFQKMGIQTYSELEDYYDTFLEKAVNEMTEEQKQCYEAQQYFVYENEESSKLIFQIQELERMDEFRDDAFRFGQTEEIAQKLIEENWFKGESQEYIERATELSKRQEMSLLPDWLLGDYIGTDMLRLAILIMICCLIIVIPYQIRERANRVLPVYLTTKTGRKLYNIQVLAVLCSCSLLCLVQCMIYAIICYVNHIFTFWNCPAGSISIALWVDMSFGSYYLLYLFLIWVISITVALAAYIISRNSANYIIGIALAIPVGVCSAFYINITLHSMYYLLSKSDYYQWKHWTVLLCFLIIGFVIFLLLKKDGKRE